ncbi:hypothetical protein HK099_004670 [Clydaea vesicula]|uniref:Uncharacterized protein n=1 Tax=Clydaea vesicula TaxID=447962 RepID=A0AAD5U1M6_9FUNG|nr:hypothetical protein HK099_004670 [Clydaea vesicula]
MYKLEYLNCAGNAFEIKLNDHSIEKLIPKNLTKAEKIQLTFQLNEFKVEFKNYETAFYSNMRKDLEKEKDFKETFEIKTTQKSVYSGLIQTEKNCQFYINLNSKQNSISPFKIFPLTVEKNQSCYDLGDALFNIKFGEEKKENFGFKMQEVNISKSFKITRKIEKFYHKNTTEISLSLLGKVFTDLVNLFLGKLVFADGYSPCDFEVQYDYFRSRNALAVLISTGKRGVPSIHGLVFAENRAKEENPIQFLSVDDADYKALKSLIVEKNAENLTITVFPDENPWIAQLRSLKYIIFSQVIPGILYTIAMAQGVYYLLLHFKNYNDEKLNSTKMVKLKNARSKYFDGFDMEKNIKTI